MSTPRSSASFPCLWPFVSDTTLRELALYHEKAPYDSQVSFATYLVTGEILSPQRKDRRGKGGRDADGDVTMGGDDDDDVGMDIFAPTQTTAPEDEEEDTYGEEDEDYEDTTVISVTIVNEKDLEGEHNIRISLPRSNTL